MLATLSVELRPRGMTEAADLGAALVLRHAASVARLVLPAVAALVAVALALQGLAGWAGGLWLVLTKPLLDRILLFVFARAAFDERPSAAALWAQRRQALWAGLPGDLTWRRFSPWRSYLMAVHALEGQAGRPARARRQLLLRGHRGHAFMSLQAHAWAESILMLGSLLLLSMLQPPGVGLGFGQLLDLPGMSMALTVLYGLVVALVEPFYVAAGFAMYLNRRVELEAWDVEQDLRHAFAA